MSSERKALKIVCFLYVLDALAVLVTGGLALAGMGGVADGLKPWTLAFGVLLLASGIFYLVLSMTGIKGANRPHTIGRFRTLAIVALVVASCGLALSVVSAGASLSATAAAPAASLVLAVLGVVLGAKVAKQAER